MTLLKRCLAGLLLAMVFVLAFLAAVDNSDPVALKFLGYASPRWSVSWWILCAFLAGAFCAFLAGLAANARLRLKARNASRLAAARARELAQLRADMPPAATSNASAKNQLDA